MKHDLRGQGTSADSAPELKGEPDLSQRLVQTYMLGVFLGANAIRDLYVLVEGPDCIHMKTQYVQGNHDWLSTLTNVSGYHRIANTALHPVHMTASREAPIRDFLMKMAEEEAVPGVVLTSMPMAFITGADYERICDEVHVATGKPIVHVKGKSLSGDWLDGYEEMLVSLARQLDIEGGEPDPNKVAIVGNLFDRNEGDCTANVRDLRLLLEGLGLEVVSIWLEGKTLEDLHAVKDAGVVISMPYGRRAARWVARRVGAKLIETELPFGLLASERWLRQIADELGRQEQAEAVIDEELSRIIPALEWVLPYFLQNRRWGFVGDPYMARGIKEIGELVGAKISFAAITNQPNHTRGLADDLGEEIELLIYPRQKEMSEWLGRRMRESGVNLLIGHSDTSVQGSAATLELGFPSNYRHCLYDRPFLGFKGFLALMDSVVNTMRRQELREAEERHRRKDGREGPGEPPPGVEGTGRPGDAEEAGGPAEAAQAGAVPPDKVARWMESLLDRIRKAGVPALQVLAVDDDLDVVLDQGEGRPNLTVEFRPKVEGAKAYKTTAKFLVRYQGVRDLSDEVRAQIDRVVVEVNEATLDTTTRFEGVASAGEIEENPIRGFERRFDFAQLDRSHGPDGIETEVLLRLTPDCNQDCPFCSAPPPARKPSPALVRACVDWVVEHMPGARVTLTGGEPTLRRTFMDELRYIMGKAELDRVLVQTNAVAFASERKGVSARNSSGRGVLLQNARPRQKQQWVFPDDDRLAFFVSVHATDAEIYDRCTASKGQLPRAIEGLKNLLALGRRVVVNAVLTSANLNHLPEMVEELPKLLEGGPLPVLHFSTLICPPHRADAPEFLVRYSELVPVVTATIERAEELGVEVEPLVSSTHASVPLCLVSTEHRASATHRPEVRPGETAYEDMSGDWVKAERCKECSMTDRCLGVPTPYGKHFGLDELQPF